jgi:hypothetical protein
VLLLMLLTQNMGIEYDEAMETIHVIKRDGSVSSPCPDEESFKPVNVGTMPAALQPCTAAMGNGCQRCRID